MEAHPAAHPKRNRTGLLAGIGIAVLLCLCLSSSSAICLIAYFLFGDGTLPLPAPSAPKADVLAKTDTPAGMLDSPFLAADSRGAVHFFWRDNETGGFFHIQKERQGKWSARENLGSFSQPIVRSTLDGRPCFFGYGIPAFSGAGYDRYWSCRTDNGWSDPEPVTGAVGSMTDFAPAFAPDGSMQFVYWGTDGLYHGGELLSEKGEQIYNLRFVIDAGGGYHVAWQNVDRTKVRYRFSGDDGNTWQPVESIAGDNSPGGFVIFDLIADRKGGVHLIWTAHPGFLHRLWARGKWGEPETAADTGAYIPHTMSCAVDADGRAYIFWQHYYAMTKGTGASLSRQNPDGTWAPPVWVISPARSKDMVADELTMAVDTDGRMHFAWQRERNTGAGPLGFNMEYTSIP